MNAADSQKYARVKAAVLKSYELVPEAYKAAVSILEET